MEIQDNLLGCVGYVATIAIMCGAFYVIQRCSPEPVKQFQETSKGIIKDVITGNEYYIDTLLYAKATHRHKDWYFADNEADAIIIEKIMNACHSYRDVETVQEMIDKYGAKKQNIASLVDGRYGYEISALYERCARNRWGGYDKLKELDSLTVECLKGGKNAAYHSAEIHRLERAIYSITKYDDMQRVAYKVYYAEDED